MQDTCPNQSEETQWIKGLKKRIYIESAETLGNPMPTSTAMIQAGLQIIADQVRGLASPAERKPVQAFYTDATDASIDGHRVSRDSVLFLIESSTTAANKYLDHQPETSPTLNSLSLGENLSTLVPLILHGISNSFAGGAFLNASGYRITDAIITNTAREALKRGVAPEQVIMLLLDNVLQMVPMIAPPEAGSSSNARVKPSTETHLAEPTLCAADKSLDHTVQFTGATTAHAPDNAIAYEIFGEIEYRPAAAMPISDHVAAGQIINAVLLSRLATVAVQMDLSFISSRLFHWLREEIDEDKSKMIDQNGAKIRIDEIYPGLVVPFRTHNPYAERASSAWELCAMLETLKGKLTATYPDCEPLRDEMRYIDSIVEAISHPYSVD